MANLQDLALAKFVQGVFANVGADTTRFNHTTPISEGLLWLLGEDLFEIPAILDLVEDRLSVEEKLLGSVERRPVEELWQMRACWHRVQAGESRGINDLLGAEVYLTLCERRGIKPADYLKRALLNARWRRRS